MITEPFLFFKFLNKKIFFKLILSSKVNNEPIFDEKLHYQSYS